MGRDVRAVLLDGSSSRRYGEYYGILKQIRGEWQSALNSAASPSKIYEHYSRSPRTGNSDTMKKSPLVKAPNFLISCIGVAALFIGQWPSNLYAQEEKAACQPGMWRTYWFMPGREHGNLHSNSRFRVNAPETSIHPRFSARSEASGSGMMQILISEDLRAVSAAELYVELWGGHPGTAEKQVSINGRNTYSIAEVGTAYESCTHQYATIPLQVTDLVNGYNAIQFTCQQGTTFWGHFIVDNACLRVLLPADHADIETAGLKNFQAELNAGQSPMGQETIRINVEFPQRYVETVSSVHLLGQYTGYDENGNTLEHDWHGFTKDRRPTAILATLTEPPFTFDWDVSMLPSQGEVGVRAIFEFQDHPMLSFVSPRQSGPVIQPRPGAQVRLFRSRDLPTPFWSRAGNVRECTIELDVEPERIESADLHVVTWTGGAGNIQDYFQLNGRFLPVAEGNGHEVLYNRLLIEPRLLRKGKNTIRLMSNTEHHGIEVLLPGPALMVRSRTD